MRLPRYPTVGPLTLKGSGILHGRSMGAREGSVQERCVRVWASGLEQVCDTLAGSGSLRPSEVVVACCTLTSTSKSKAQDQLLQLPRKMQYRP